MNLLLLALLPVLIFAMWWWIKRPRTFGLANIYLEGVHDKGYLSLFPDTDSEIPCCF
jgi:hypothetical protein